MNSVLVLWFFCKLHFRNIELCCVKKLPKFPIVFHGSGNSQCIWPYFTPYTFAFRHQFAVKHWDCRGIILCATRIYHGAITILHIDDFAKAIARPSKEFVSSFCTQMKDISTACQHSTEIGNGKPFYMARWQGNYDKFNKEKTRAMSFGTVNVSLIVRKPENILWRFTNKFDKVYQKAWSYLNFSWGWILYWLCQLLRLFIKL